MCSVDGCRPLRCDAKKTLRTAAALWRGIAAVRFHVTLRLQPVKSSVNRADRYFAPGARFDLLPHGDPVSAIFQPQQRQENDVLELPEVFPSDHYFYIIDQIQRQLKTFAYVEREHPLALWFFSGSGGDSLTDPYPCTSVPPEQR